MNKLCLRFKALKNFKDSDGFSYYCNKDDILVETCPDSGFIRPVKLEAGMSGLILSAFSEEKSLFFEQMSPVIFKETKNYKEFYKSEYEGMISLSEKEIKHHKKCIAIHEKTIRRYKEIGE